VNQAKKTEFKQKLLSLVPANGTSIGNVTLREQLREDVAKLGDRLSDEDYWLLRDALIDEGAIQQGKGKGGSVRRVVIETETAYDRAPGTVKLEGEVKLYERFQKAITSGYGPANRIKRFISEITASQGRRSTGGKWTRPDMTLIAIRTYSFTPGKRLEVITFEIKPDLDSAFEGVFEALAHSAFAHRSHLAVNISGVEGEDIPDDRVVQECTRLGIGYITFRDPADYNTFETVISAKLTEPDPDEVDSFIKTQISAKNQDELREWLR
jgi:hypothetical protein